MLIASIISLILLIAGYILTRFIANRQQKNNDYEIMTSPSRGSRALAHIFYFFGLFFLVVVVLFYALPTKRNGTEIAFLFVGDLVAVLGLLLVFVIYVQFEAIKGDTVYIKRFIKVREIKIADITSADLTGLGYVIITKNGGGFTMSAGTLRSAELVEKIKERKEGKLFSINPDIPSPKEEEGAEKEETALAKIGKDFRNMVPKLKKNALITFLVNTILTVLLGVVCFVTLITLFDEGYLRSLCLAVFAVAALWELIYVFSFFKGQSNLTKDLEHDDEWLGNKNRFVSFSVKGSFVGAHPDELLSVSIPVKRADDVAVGKHLTVPDFLAVTVMKIDDAVVAPVCGGGNLKTRPFGTVVGAADSLAVAVDVTDYDFSVL